ncbi:cyclic GMP-AMP synthase-like receptor [Athalia rosae]|uniref:cyclic GMP-AMP synthase-like receptor n=1 Tax=Athalia rosae TaxID=37344 RepID=UPI0020341719|nr:cyclic GMP-AMP synthase-like receptor [Athalia rosae]
MTTFILGDRRFKDDTVFNRINEKVVSMKPEKITEYKAHLKTVLDMLIERLKQQDNLFNSVYRRVEYTGSFYEGLKVGSPEEFDLNVIIHMPINYEQLIPVNAPKRPGYIKIKPNTDVLSNLTKHVRYTTEYRGIENWFDGSGFLNSDKFRQWFESVVTRAFPQSEYVDKKYILRSDKYQYEASIRKSGPAFTYRIILPDGKPVDVDIVPALEFQTPPPQPFLCRKTQKKHWFAISKPLEGLDSHLSWRPSFWSMEQEWLTDDIRGRVKPVIRQMKKLRDTQNMKSIASYFIKTLFLHELEIQFGPVGSKIYRNPEFQCYSLTSVFVYMLKKLYVACKEGKLYDFWNPQFNHFSKISEIELENIANRLNNIIKKINTHIDTDKYIIASYILNSEELQLVKLPELSNRSVVPSRLCARPIAQSADWTISRPLAEPPAQLTTDAQEESNFWFNVAMGTGAVLVAAGAIGHLIHRNANRND